MEYVTKGACKLLGDCKPVNLSKELEKVIQQKDTTTLEANNARLAIQVANLKVEVAKKNEEIRLLQAQSKEDLDWIWVFIGNLGDVENKVCFFDNDVKMKG